MSQCRSERFRRETWFVRSMKQKLFAFRRKFHRSSFASNGPTTTDSNGPFQKYHRSQKKSIRTTTMRFLVVVVLGAAIAAALPVFDSSSKSGVCDPIDPSMCMVPCLSPPFDSHFLSPASLAQQFLHQECKGNCDRHQTQLGFGDVAEKYSWVAHSP